MGECQNCNSFLFFNCIVINIMLSAIDQFDQLPSNTINYGNILLYVESKASILTDADSQTTTMWIFYIIVYHFLPL